MLSANVGTVAACILEAGGEVVGGYVRDLILHNHDPGLQPHHPEVSRGSIRCALPGRATLRPIVRALRDAGFGAGVVTLAASPRVGSTSPTRFRVDLSAGSIRSVDVYVDVRAAITKNGRGAADEEPPLGFECDALAMRLGGTDSSSRHLEVEIDPRCAPLLGASVGVTGIVRAIHLKRAVVVECDAGRRRSPERIARKVRAGWTIVDDSRWVLGGGDAPVCCICLGEARMHLHKRRACCNARYHLECYEKVVCRESRCPFCRAEMATSRAYKDGVR